MSFLEDSGLGAANLFESPFTALLDPGDLAGTKSGKEAKKAADQAAREQEDAQFAGIAETRRQFDITQESFKPFQEAGVGALGQQQALLGLSGQEAQQAAFAGLQESPGQKFIRERQQRSLVRGAAAAGQRLGGNVLTALQEQGTGFAQQDIQNQFGRLGQLAGQGQAATTSLGQFGAQASGDISRGLVGAGQARASGILGVQQASAQQQEQQQQLAATAFKFFSDERLKEDINLIGNDKNGNIYNFKYLGSPIVYTGRIAQELQDIRPDAVGLHESGYLQVTEEFKPEVIRWH